MRRKWDRFAIKAEIHRRGKTLTELALEGGADPSACRVALIRPRPKGEQIISEFLGIPRHILWPDRYPRRDSDSVSRPAQGRRHHARRTARPRPAARPSERRKAA